MVIVRYPFRFFIRLGRFGLSLRSEGDHFGVFLSFSHGVVEMPRVFDRRRHRDSLVSPNFLLNLFPLILNLLFIRAGSISNVFPMVRIVFEAMQVVNKGGTMGDLCVGHF